MKRTTLYFIYNSVTDRIKIGVSSNVERRIAALECAAGARLDLLGVLERASDLERPLHSALRALREYGEWFTPTEELLRIARAPSRQRIKALISETTVEKGAWRRRKDMEIEAKERRREIRVAPSTNQAAHENDEGQGDRNRRMLGLA